MNQQAGKVGEFKLELAWNLTTRNIVRVGYGDLRDRARVSSGLENPSRWPELARGWRV